MDHDFSPNPVGFMFRKGWPWAEEFKLEVLRINEMKRNEDRWKIMNGEACYARLGGHQQLSIVDMRGTYLALAFAVAYCCVCLVAENILYFLVQRYRNSRWNVPYA
jgi:hypothetical protein